MGSSSEVVVVSSSVSSGHYSICRLLCAAVFVLTQLSLQVCLDDDDPNDSGIESSNGNGHTTLEREGRGVSYAF